MTSATVTDFSVQAIGGMMASRQSQNDNAANFADFMQGKGKAVDTANSQPVKSAVQDPKVAYEKTENKAAKEIAKEADKVQQSDMPEDERIDEKVQEAEKECILAIAGELGVSEEDVEQALQILGLTVADLLQQGNMNLLIAQVTDVSPVEMVTDGALFSRMETLVDQVTQELSQVASELGMDLDSLVAAIEEELSQATDVQDAKTDQADIMPQQVDDAPVITGTKQMTEPVEGEETVQADTRVSDSRNVAESSAANTVLEENVQSDGFAGQETEGRQKDENGGFASQEPGSGVTNAISVSQEVPQDVVQPEESFERFDMEQTRKIIDQIADYVKLHQRQQVTELEMQLNPASLGSIHLQVASKAGAVSAQLIAQEQAVAAALESQIAQVKESLEAQGLKVDAVEVTVASHEFEQNLDNQGKQQEEQARRSAGRSKRRILDLNDISGADELTKEQMTDAERLQIELMRMGGNRLNFQV